jgi:hypothetical protein
VTPHVCPPVPTSEHAFCDHTATTDRDAQPQINALIDLNSNVATTSLSAEQTNKLAVLLAALDGVVISDAERASLTWLAGCETHTVANIAAMITRARQTGKDRQ